MEKQVNERFKSLTSVSAIVDTMIQGLKNRWIEVRMESYGDYRVSNGQKICYGCAATNTLCQLMGETFEPGSIWSESGRAHKINYGIHPADLHLFEKAIDRLRTGNPISFLNYLTEIEHLLPLTLPALKEVLPEQGLPYLDTNNWEENLHHYEAYRDWLIAKGL